MDELQVTSRLDDDVGYLSVGGEVRMEIATHLYEAGALLIQQGARHLVINLKGVLFMDSASLATLIRLDRQLDDKEGKLVLFGLSPAVKRVMVNSGLESRFPAAEDEAAARQLLEA